jgi:hypothetical protein
VTVYVRDTIDEGDTVAPSLAHVGIAVRHREGCRSVGGGRCSCAPKYLAEVFDRRSGKRIYATFPTLAAAKA